MTTERQITANRANAAKSTGPATPEGKRISSQNAARHDLASRTVLLKDESTRRFNDLAAALMLHFQPRNALEISLVQTMTAARWRLLRLWGIQAVGFELEMARQDPSAGPAPSAQLSPFAAWPKTPASSRSNIALKPPTTANTIVPWPRSSSCAKSPMPA